jgi:hypothetical protein
MATLNDSDRSAFRALLAKHGRAVAEFNLHEEHLRQAADGTIEGYLWVIHARTGHRMVYGLNRSRGSWLDRFEGDLQGGAFPADHTSVAPA